MGGGGLESGGPVGGAGGADGAGVGSRASPVHSVSFFVEFIMVCDAVASTNYYILTNYNPALFQIHLTHKRHKYRVRRQCGVRG